MTQDTINAVGIGITATSAVIVANAFVVKLVVGLAVKTALLDMKDSVQAIIHRHEHECPAMKHFINHIIKNK